MNWFNRLRVWWWRRRMHLDCAQWQLQLWAGRDAPMGACTKCYPRMEKMRELFMAKATLL